MKIAVVSRHLPPSFSGQAMMLYRLLKDVSESDYCLISSVAFETRAEENYSHALAGKYFPLSTRFELKRGGRQRLEILLKTFTVSAGAYMRGRQIRDIVNRERCEAILACSSGDDLLDVPSGYVGSRLSGAAFYLYMFDTYSHMWLQPETNRSSFLGRLIEPHVLKAAAGVIVTNETVRDLLRDRYEVDSLVIHNPCDISEYEKLPIESPDRRDGEVRIVYTGAIYEAHYDAFRNLVTAIKLLRRDDVKLHLYTAFSPEAIAAQGISGPVVFHEHQPVVAIPKIQRQADVLFLPMAFESPYPELIRVSSPSKVGEFLAARRPVLVHAPPDSFVSTYFRKHDCGLVVDRPDAMMLAESIEELLADGVLRRRLSENGWDRAGADFSLRAAREKFAGMLKLNISETG